MLRIEECCFTNKLCILSIVSESRGESPDPCAGKKKTIPRLRVMRCKPRRAVLNFIRVVYIKCVSRGCSGRFVPQPGGSSKPSSHGPLAGRQVRIHCPAVTTRVQSYSCVVGAVISVVPGVANFLCERSAFMVLMRLLTVVIHVLTFV